MRKTSGPRLAFALIFLIVAAVSAGKIMWRARHGFGDHIAYYRAAERMLAGADPYAPTGDTYVYLYPPAWALLVAPLTRAGPVAFGAMWAALLGASWLAVRWLVRRVLARCGVALGGWTAVAADLVLLRFTLGAWSSGQVTLPLAVLSLGGVALALEGSVAWGAALIGVAASIKIYPLFLALVVIALARERAGRAVGALCAAGLAVSFAPACLVGWDGFVALVRDGFLGSGMANLESQRFWSGRCAPIAFAWHAAGLEADGALKAIELAWALSSAALVVASSPGEDELRAGAPAPRVALWIAFAMVSMLVSTPLLGENYLAFLALPVAAALAAGNAALAGAVGLAAVLLNAHSPLFVGPVWAMRLERLGLTPIALTALWGALGVALAGYARASSARSQGRNSGFSHMNFVCWPWNALTTRPISSS